MEKNPFLSLLFLVFHFKLDLKLSENGLFKKKKIDRQSQCTCQAVLSLVMSTYLLVTRLSFIAQPTQQCTESFFSLFQIPFWIINWYTRVLRDRDEVSVRDIECKKHDSFFLFYIHWSISYIRPASFEVCIW